MYNVIWRMPYDADRDEYEGTLAAERGMELSEGSVIKGATCESLTQQQFAKDADLNEIVRRCGIKDADMPVIPLSEKVVDLSVLPDDLRSVLDIARAATDHFMSLPAALRAEFGNSPARLHSFVSDPANTEKCFEKGLLKRPAKPARRGDDAPPRRRRADADADARDLAELRRRRNDPTPPGGVTSSAPPRIPVS